MPVIPTVKKIGSASYEYSWSGTSPYDVYQDGDEVLFQTTDTSLIVHAPDSLEPPALEIFDADDTTTPESLLYPPRATLQWRGVSQAEHYRVEQFVDAAWATQVPVIVEREQGYIQWTTDALADVTTHQFRVIAVDAFDYESEPLPFDIFINRNPPPPSINMVYGEGPPTITITAR